MRRGTPLETALIRVKMLRRDFPLCDHVPSFNPSIHFDTRQQPSFLVNALGASNTTLA